MQFTAGRGDESRCRLRAAGPSRQRSRKTSGMLWLLKRYRPTGTVQGRYLLTAMLTIGWRIVESTSEERALLEAHGLACGRVQ